MKPLNLLFLLLLMLPGAGLAQQRANPFIRNFEPDQYGEHVQNWAVEQTAEGFIVVGNGQGALIFDGHEFLKVRGLEARVTSLFTSSDGNVYLAGSNRFGMLGSATDGYPEYRSLAAYIDSTDREFGSVWNMAESEEGIWFSTAGALFRWDGRTIRKWSPLEHTFFNVFFVNGRLYTGEYRTGLLQLDASGELEMAPGGERLATDLVPYFMLPYDEQRALIGTYAGGLFLYYTDAAGDVPAGTLEPFETEADELLKSSVTVAGIRLLNGTYAIGTETAGAVVIGRRGELVQQLDKNSGLQDPVVHSLYEDNRGNLWLALNYGLSMAETGRPVSRYGETNGLEGSVYSFTLSGDQLYAGTSVGLFRREGNRFVANRDVKSQTWDLDLTAPYGGGGPHLLAANNFGLYRVSGDGAERLTFAYVMSLRASRSFPERIYAGTTQGLALVERVGAAAYRDRGLLIPTANPVRQILETGEGDLWLATQEEGVVFVPADLDTGSVRTYGMEEGLGTAGNFRLLWEGGVLYACNPEGIFRYEESGDRFVAWRPAGLPEDEMEGLYVAMLRGDTLWTGASSLRIPIIRYSGIFSETPRREAVPFAQVPSTTTLSMGEMGGNLWFGNAKGLYQFIPQAAGPPSSELPVFVRRVDIVSDSIRSVYRDTLDLPYGNSRLRFQVSAPMYDAAGSVEYRYYLEGYDEKWSEWSPNYVTEYTSLREGDYRLRVEARNREGVTTQVAGFSFRIRPPWYRTAWAYFGYLVGFLLLAGALGWTFSRFRMQRLQQFNSRLEQMVQERSLEIQEKNERLVQLNQEKNEFMNIAAHDLRNPLFGIQGLAGMLSDENEFHNRVQVREYGRLIRNSTQRMFRIIDNYLNVHRIEKGDLTADNRPLVLQGTVSDAVARFVPVLQAKQMHISYIPPIEPVTVTADEDLLSQVLDNLISNAVKYSPIGSSIEVRIRKEPPVARIDVSDEGPGISEEDQKRLFRKFSRLAHRPTGNESSIGLGLSIAKQLAVMMKGNIICKSSPGAGSVFSVTLPLHQENG